MGFKVFETVWDNATYVIEEDSPAVGAYLYCYENEVCVGDFLQNSIEDCIAFAFVEFGIPVESWRAKENVG
jgi:hypothetical protein